MTRKLNDADRAAVDLMFDRITDSGGRKEGGNPGGNVGDGFVQSSTTVDGERLSAVQNILNLLEQMPAPEPPADLVVRTLQRINGAFGTGSSRLAPIVDPTQPPA